MVALAEALGALVVLGVLRDEGTSGTTSTRVRERGAHLVAELVRGEAEDDETLVLVLLVDCRDEGKEGDEVKSRPSQAQ